MILIIFLTAFLFRFYNLLSFPIFTDESIYLYWAKLLTTDWRYLLLSVWDGKTPLYIWLVAFFLKFGINYLFIGRMISLLAGMATIFGIYLLAKNLFNKKIAIVATLLYALNPLALFYERLALMDSLMNALVFYSCLTLVTAFNKKEYKFSLLSGLLLGLAYLAKPSAIIFILGVFYLFVFGRNKNDFVFLIKNSFLTLLVFFPFSQIVKLSSAYFMMKMKTKEFILSFQELWQNPFSLFFKNIKMVFVWFIEYQGIIALVLFLLSFLLWWFDKSRRKTIFVFLYFITPLLIFSFIGKIIFPRYFTVTIPYFIILISHLLMQKFNQFKLLMILFLGILTINWLKFDFNLLLNYHLLKLPQIERWQYLTSSSSGYGLEKIYSFIDSRLNNNNKIVIVTDTAFGLFPYALELKYWDKKDKNIFFLPTWKFDENFKQELENIRKKIKKSLIIFLFKETKKSTIEKELLKNFPLRFVLEVKRLDNSSNFLIYSYEI